MHTGYFRKVYKRYRYVSFASFNKFWTGETYPKFFPPVDIIK